MRVPLQLLAGFFLLAQATSAVAAVPARPNIVFCFADDWGYGHASFAGDRSVKTPAVDRLAREGVHFTNAYAAAPSCSPSRAAVLSGQWPWRLREGSALLGFLPADIPLYSDLLGQSGYHVGYMEKGYAPGSSSNRKRNPAGDNYHDFAAFLAKRPAGAPFCFWLGSKNPHRPYVWKSGAGRDLSAIDVPPYLADTPTTRQDIADYYADVETFDGQVAEVIRALEASGELENTIIVVAGDNGWPFPRAKATCYDAGVHEMLIVRWGGIRGGRQVNDFVSLADLCPTFLEAAEVKIPEAVTARSLLPILRSNREGWVDAKFDHVLAGMETHVACHDLGNGKFGGYPMRVLITKDYHYIRNFAPDRWPAGDPAPDLATLDYPGLATKTQVGYSDDDASPSKAELVLGRDNPRIRPLFEQAFLKRPARELYSRRDDPYQLHNLAADPAYTKVVAELDAQLMAELAATKDPRATGGGAEFDTYSVYPPAWKGGTKVK